MEYRIIKKEEGIYYIQVKKQSDCSFPEFGGSSGGLHWEDCFYEANRRGWRLMEFSTSQKAEDYINSKKPKVTELEVIKEITI